MKHIILLILSILPMLCQAQDDEVYATCRAYSVEGMENIAGTQTKDESKSKKKTAIRAWFVCVPIDMAYRLKKDFESIDKENYSAISRFKTTKGLREDRRGIFKQRTKVGFAIVCIDEYDNISVHEIRAGKTEYESVAKVNAAIKGDVDVIAKSTFNGRSRTTDTGDGTETFKIELPIEKGYFTDNTRIILQCMAINCQNEDTTDYCKPVVYEGTEYHKLQDRRKDFDYMHKDSLAHAYEGGYDGLADMGDGRLLFSTSIVYRKPDITQSYRGDWAYSIENYHKPTLKSTFGGSCLKFRPFKFLNFDAAIPPMELTSEFQETAEINTHDVSTTLDLKFVTGKSILREDSMNYVMRDNLIKELQSYGDRLVSPKVIGGASPDGSLARNIQLARDRANVAKGMIERFLPRRQHLSIDHKVYTWSDVADSLDRRGQAGKAKQVRDIIESVGTDNDLALSRAMQKLPFYGTDTLQTILTNQRMMQCSYSYIIERVFSASEVVDEYYLHKQEYMNGEKHFSSGDFFNLFANVADSTDLDSITILAYRELRKNPDWFIDRLSPYVLNSMQRLNQRLGAADTMMLKPYLRIDDKDSLGIDVFKDFDGVPIKMNRRDLLLTQAMSYYQLQRFDQALSIFEWMKAEGKAIPGMEKLEHFMALRSLYGKENLDDKQKADLAAAKNYVLGLSDENKAILYTEIKEWSTPQQAEDYVDLLDDSNPKKWYLKGILWARKVNETQPDLSQYEDSNSIGDTIKTDDLDLSIYGFDNSDVQETPHYLAYFHHSFKMQPKYLDLYYSDDQVGEDARKRHKYLRKDVPEYERLFKLLKRRDDEHRQELLSGMYEPTENETETESGDANTEANQQQ